MRDQKKSAVKLFVRFINSIFMSRIGKRPIAIPGGVEAKIEKDCIIIKGKKGELRQALHPSIEVQIADKVIHINPKNTDKKQNALWGLYGALIANMVKGVTEGFAKQLEISGIGFKARIKDKKLILEVGYSHDVEYPMPAGIEISVEENRITVSGFDKQLVGETAAQIRAIKKPEPYKGKGIKYSNEIIRRKAGKVAKGAS